MSVRLSEITGEIVIGSGTRLKIDTSGRAISLTSIGTLDATAGRLMKVGDFGLGSSNPAGPTGNDCNNAVLPGYYLITTGSANIPPITTTNALTVSRGSNVVLQTTQQDGTRIFSRRSTDSGATWSAWVRIGGQVLGTVSQSSGTPVGAIIEKGSNANGEYVRFADGTQICSLNANTTLNVNTVFGELFHSPVQTWTYPAAFSEGPTVAVSAHSATGQMFGAPSAAPVATELSFRVVCPVTQTSVTTRIYRIAIGRWY